MSKFKQIDIKLKAFAQKLKVKVATNGTVYFPEPSFPVEERSVVCIDGRIGKGIMIRPDIKPGIGVSSDTWDFINLAWLEDVSHSTKPSPKPMWMRTLIKKGQIELLEKEIDGLLAISEENLEQIELKHLKKPHS
ncbi:hypothetical protein [Flavisolibacter tropicus]|uniref:Uncharacterized protein n=1 Tax=Flavisolibacter tropicus TaxID=1492898 RepID=A0A172TZB2_9BACT|nr:hypothetical protein [Flavisolibacter tropicus]ANE52322.1 hypothetical protein SY85_19355 [Flavisolibacter tropicus]